MRSRWSPDGSWIAYVNHGFPVGQIWVIRSNGTDNRHLSWGWEPVWSADGRVVYDGAGAGFYVDGTSAPPATPPPLLHERDTRWSPDGKRVTFASDMGDGRWRTYVRNADGSGLHTVTTGGMDEFPVDWSPDGRSLLLWANDWMIAGWLVVVDADGGNRRQVKKGFVPTAFSPDGTKILAYEGQSGKTHIMRTDGTGVTHVPALQGASDWGPGSVDSDSEPTPAPSTTPTPTTKPAPAALPVTPTTAPETKMTVAPRSSSAPETTTSTGKQPPPDATSVAALGSPTGAVGADGSDAAAVSRATDTSGQPGSLRRAPWIAASVLLLATVGLVSCRTALRMPRPRR